MSHAEVIVFNKSANILEMSTVYLSRGKICCNNVEMGLGCQMGWFKNTPKLPLKLDVGVE